MSKRIASGTYSRLVSISLLIRNLWMASKLALPPTWKDDDIEFCTASSLVFNEVQTLYRELNDGLILRGWTRWLLRVCPSKVCVIAREVATQKVVGIDIYYFNNRDFREKTIHEGFVGVRPDFRRRGIAEKMRMYALSNFSNCHFLTGVSSKVSLNNSHSLNGAIRLGFVEQEQYFDPLMQERRSYLVCNFDAYRSRAKNIEIVGSMK